MNTLFLFGAGASFGSGPCFPSPPPLGGQLFSALQAAGGVAATVSPDLAQAFADDFEVGMDRFWEEHNTRTSELLRDMARFFAQYEPLPGNCYAEVLKVLGRTKIKSVMVTTNYDLLIEHAIGQVGLKVTYGSPAAPGNISLLKIHGSCNFLPDVRPRQISGLSFDLRGAKGGSILEAGVVPARSKQEIIEFCDREDSLAPALALYSPSKQVLFCRSFITAQQQAWVSALKEAWRVYVIGLRVHTVDEHIWGALARAKAPIHYVGFEPEEFRAWANANHRSKAFVLARTFSEALPLIARQLGSQYRPNS